MVWNLILKHRLVPGWVFSKKAGLFCYLSAVPWCDKWLTSSTDNLRKRREQGEWWNCWCPSDHVCMWLAGRAPCLWWMLVMLVTGITIQVFSRCQRSMLLLIKGFSPGRAFDLSQAHYRMATFSLLSKSVFAFTYYQWTIYTERIHCGAFSTENSPKYTTDHSC